MVPDGVAMRSSGVTPEKLKRPPENETLRTVVQKVGFPKDGRYLVSRLGVDLQVPDGVAARSL